MSLGTHYDQFMLDAVQSGRYASQDDVIRKAILLLEMEEQNIYLLRNELAIGETSSMIEDFNSKSFLEQIRIKYL
jgi:putative addiction module CopG family antidote